MNRFLRKALSRALVLATFVGLPVIAADAPGHASRPAIYDEQADGARQIADALTVAKKEDGDHHDPAKVLAFLNQWKPAPKAGP